MGIGFLRYFFSYVPSGLPPEVPAVEPPDPNADRSLSEPFRTARRNLVALCAVSVAWSTAQFSLADLHFAAAGLSVNLKDASVPFLLAVGLAYLTARWVFEFAMMPRHVRRWPLAQLDFRVVSIVARFSLLAITAGALDRSFRSVTIVVVLLASLAILSRVLVRPLMRVTIRVRLRARKRAHTLSAANAAFEALVWAGLFAVCLSVAGTVAIAVASYRYQPLRNLLWPVPPHPVAFAGFIFSVVLIFVSRWLLRPVIGPLFAKRPGYYTWRDAEGSLCMRYVNVPKEPLL